MIAGDANVQYQTLMQVARVLRKSLCTERALTDVRVGQIDDNIGWEKPPSSDAWQQ